MDLTGYTFIGVDLTAGTWESGMLKGRKSFPVICLEGLSGGQLRLTEVKECLTLDEFIGLALVKSAETIVIDGPCKANGMDLNSDHTGFVYPDPGFREAERILSRMGIKVFWTTENTLRNFDGAARWIARSLLLFDLLGSDDSFSNKVIETHPHAVFSMLQRFHFPNRRLDLKKTESGRQQRIRLLRLYIDGLNENDLTDHDHVDSCGAALLGVLHKAGMAIPVGSEDKGGLIWIPDTKGVETREIAR
jgi:predicted nuclease with RNAse H fold